MKKRKILQPGDRMHDLQVLSVHHKDHRHRRFLLCRCVCGVEKVIQASLITSGNTKSCGCLVRRSAKKRKLKNNHSEVTAIILQYKRHARDRGIEWKLKRGEVDSIVRLPCHYCGTKGGNLKKMKNCKEGFAHNGIDRVDSGRGYDSDNVVPCCGVCNRAKRDFSKKDFLAWVERIHEYQKAMADQWNFSCCSCNPILQLQHNREGGAYQ